MAYSFAIEHEVSYKSDVSLNDLSTIAVKFVLILKKYLSVALRI